MGVTRDESARGSFTVGRRRREIGDGAAVVGPDGALVWGHLLGVAALTLLLVFCAGVGSGRSLLHVGGPSRLLSPRSYVGDFLLVGFAILGIVVAIVVSAMRPARRRKRSEEPELVVERELGGRWSSWSAIAIVVAVLAGAVAAFLFLPHHALSPRASGLSTGSVPSEPASPLPAAAPARSGLPPVHWWGLVIVALLLLGTALAIWSIGHRRGAGFEEAGKASDQVRAALELSLDDIEREPDPRRAVIKAYGRMETALGSHGLGRRPFETSLEFLSRSLVALRVSRAAVERLTALFERAKFSQHEVDGSMKRDALAALVSVRDELQGRDR